MVVRKGAVATLVLALLSLGLVAQASSFSTAPWATAVEIELFGPGAHQDFNTPTSLDGCPLISADGKSFYMASDRPGGLGGLDIWVSSRKHTDEPWGAPVNVGAPINSTYNDFCPTIARDGHEFFFVSNRPGYCGPTPNSDIYTTRFRNIGNAEPVVHLGCTVNSSWDEHSPWPMPESGSGPVLYFSSAQPSNPADTPGDHDLYVSQRQGRVYGAPAQLAGINTPDFHEGQPNVRRDGLEIFFYSNRPGGSGGNDIYSSLRGSTADAWPLPVNLGPAVNSAGSETRPSLAWEGSTLYFGSTRAGSNDIYATTR